MRSPKWGEKEAEDRKKEKIGKIMKFLFTVIPQEDIL